MVDQTRRKPASYDVIRPEVAYPTKALDWVMGWGDTAVRSARRNGLLVRYSHGRSFVLGADLIAYITEHGSLEPPTAHRRAGR